MRIRDMRHPARTAVQVLAVAACYYGAGRLGLLEQLVVEDAVVTPIWPPTGIALAALLVLGLRAAAGIAIGALFVILSISTLQPSTLGVLAGQTLAPVCAYLMLRRVGFRTELDRLRDGFALVFLGALTGMLISATVGVGVLLLTGKLPSSGFWPVWLAWWVGDAMGVLLVTPVLLVMRRARWPVQLDRWREVLALVVCAAALVPLATTTPLSLLFLVSPLLIWVALRFQLAGSTLCALFASVMATTAATNGTGPFAGHSRVAVMIGLQAFNGCMALTALLLSAVIAEQLSTRRRIEHACRELAELVDQLAPGESVPSWPLPRRDDLRGRGRGP